MPKKFQIVQNVDTGDILCVVGAKAFMLYDGEYDDSCEVLAYKTKEKDKEPDRIYQDFGLFKAVLSDHFKKATELELKELFGYLVNNQEQAYWELINALKFRENPEKMMQYARERQEILDKVKAGYPLNTELIITFTREGKINSTSNEVINDNKIDGKKPPVVNGYTCDEPICCMGRIEVCTQFNKK